MPADPATSAIDRMDVRGWPHGRRDATQLPGLGEQPLVTYRSRLCRDTCAELAVTPKYTRPYRPQTNGKIERFHLTLADGWAFKRLYTSERQRRAAMPAWIHQYNHHRPHTAIGKATPISRLTNLAGQYT
jgi:transposase InsO family protein